jgi:hypothetical protein
VRKRVKAKLSGDDLVQIEVRARAVTRGETNEHQRNIIARQVCRDDVPDLLVEIRRLRAAMPAAPVPSGGELGEGTG